MKGLVIAALLVLCISSLEAVLQCYRCTAENLPCSNLDVEVCKNPEDQCTRVTRNFPKYTVTKGCMTPEQSDGVSSGRFAEVYTCSTDLCN